MVVTCCRIPQSNRKITPYRLPRTCQTLPRASQTTIIISVCVIKISHNYHLLLLAQHCEHQCITNKMSNIRTIHDTPTASSNRFSMSPIGENPIYVGTVFGIEITLHPLLLLYFSSASLFVVKTRDIERTGKTSPIRTQRRTVFGGKRKKLPSYSCSHPRQTTPRWNTSPDP